MREKCVNVKNIIYYSLLVAFMYKIQRILLRLKYISILKLSLPKLGLIMLKLIKRRSISYVKKLMSNFWRSIKYYQCKRTNTITASQTQKELRSSIKLETINVSYNSHKLCYNFR